MNDQVNITNPEKILWPELEIKKIEYIEYLYTVAPFMLPFIKDRPVTLWRFPDGAAKEPIIQKYVPHYAPSWLKTFVNKGKQRVLINDLRSLIWVGNYAALEIHVPFNRILYDRYPSELAFDIDPPDEKHFDQVIEVALAIRAVLDSLGLSSIPKTSGGTGLQIYITIQPIYTYEQVKLLAKFVAEYIEQQIPQLVTLQRRIDKREQKIYLDYVQFGYMKTLPAPYSARATSLATVSTPLGWSEIEKGNLSPAMFNIRTVQERIKMVGDLFADTTPQSLDSILEFLGKYQTE